MPDTEWSGALSVARRSINKTLWVANWQSCRCDEYCGAETALCYPIINVSLEKRGFLVECVAFSGAEKQNWQRGSCPHFLKGENMKAFNKVVLLGMCLLGLNEHMAPTPSDRSWQWPCLFLWSSALSNSLCPQDLAPYLELGMQSLHAGGLGEWLNGRKKWMPAIEGWRKEGLLRTISSLLPPKESLMVNAPGATWWSDCARWADVKLWPVVSVSLPRRWRQTDRLWFLWSVRSIGFIRHGHLKVTENSLGS